MSISQIDKAKRVAVIARIHLHDLNLCEYLWILFQQFHHCVSSQHLFSCIRLRDDDFQQQSETIDDSLPLAPLDPLAPISCRKLPPFFSRFDG